MQFFERLMMMDRRWVFLFLAAVCFFTYYVEYDVPIYVEPETERIYTFIDSLPEGDIILLAIDYDPNSMAELHPMTYTIVEHAWRKNLRLIITALSQNGPGMADQAIRDISDSLAMPATYNGVEYPAREIVNGEDYVFLGYKPYYALVILGMGQDFRLPFPNDYYGTPLDSLPMMRRVVNYDHVACVISLSSGTISDGWISYGQGRFGFPLFFGLTGVMTAQYYPFYGSGQLSGLMGGMLGAAQYEFLADNYGLARDAMKVQLPAHVIIILFIIMGNVGYFASRRRERLGGVS
jgi:hypothetical protein